MIKVVEAINRGLQRGMAQYPVDVRTILCCMRKNPEWYVENQNIIVTYERNKTSSIW